MDELKPEWQTTWHALRGVLGSKWSIHVLRLLGSGPRGFNEMKRELDGITATMLSRRLEELRCHGFVDRTVEETTPPTTTYRLTAAGAEVLTHLEEIEKLTTLCHDPPEGSTRGCEDDLELTCAGSEDVCVTVTECSR